MASNTFIVEAKYYSVRDELIRRGWIESDIPESYLLWTNLKLVDFENPSFHWINHFKGSQHFSNKAYLTYHLLTTTTKGILPLTWSPACHDVKHLIKILLGGIIDDRMSDENVLCQLLSSPSPASESIWIVKPIGLSCGENICVYRGLESTLAAVHAYDGKCIVQKYIERPLLIRQRRKFDIRQWVLVTSIDPLIIYCFSECYLRLSSVPFTLDEAALHDPLVHLTNHSIQRTAASENESSETHQRYDGLCNTMMTQGEFDQWLKEQYNGSGFDELLRPQIAAIATQIVLSVRDRLSVVRNGFEWLGLDLMVMEEEAGSRLKAVLLEANTSPDISLSTPVTARLIPIAVQDLFKLIFEEDSNRPWTAIATADELSWQMTFDEQRNGEDAFRFSDYCNITVMPILQQSAVKRKSRWNLRNECRVPDRSMLDEALHRIQRQKVKEEKINNLGNDEDDDEI